MSSDPTSEAAEAKPVAEPRPASSVLLVRPSATGDPGPIEVYMIRRKQGMRFLGGYYAFPGGKVDPADAAADSLARCAGLDGREAEALLSETKGVPAFAFWVTAIRELLEESGILLACDASGRAVDASRGALAGIVERGRKALMAGEAPFAALLAAADLYGDLRRLRYLSHFVTPRSSPIRFAARFFLCPLPSGQEPRLFTEETSEGFWIHPGEGYRRFLEGEMAMAEPAEYALAYLAQFDSLDDLWAAHLDGRHKFEGLVHRIEFWSNFDWKNNRWRGPMTAR